MSNLDPSYLYKGGSRWLLLAGGVIALDQWTKSLVTARLDEFESVVLLPILDFMRLHNEGAAFSLLSDASGWQRWFFVIVGLVISGLIIVTLLRHSQSGRFFRLGLTLILGGALGNIIDRVYQGYVVDFVDLYWQAWHWPAFNIADVGITIGALIVLFEVSGSLRTTPGTS